MSKHTPGPWYVGGPTEYCFQLAIEPSIGAAYGGGEEVQANAHLIAAAPELLEAVEEVLGVLAMSDRDGQVLITHEMQQEWEHVLAKAKGENSCTQ